MLAATPDAPKWTDYLTGTARGPKPRTAPLPRAPSEPPKPNSMRTRRRSAASTFRALRNPDKRNNQNENNGGSKKDVI